RLLLSYVSLLHAVYSLHPWGKSWLSFPCISRGCNPVARITSLGHFVLLYAAHAGDRQPGKGLGDDLLVG
ncbi:hypothetical protein XENOCAPTIV_008734, partial [Xenoophorus captivus]